MSYEWLMPSPCISNNVKIPIFVNVIYDPGRLEDYMFAMWDAELLLRNQVQFLCGFGMSP